MDISLVLQRRLIAALVQSARCHRTSTLVPLQRARRFPNRTAYQHKQPSGRQFSHAAVRRQEAATDSPTSSASPLSPSQTSKQELQSYIDSVQKVIDNYNLKDRISSRAHENLIISITHAETRLNAPNALPDSFGATLQTLRTEVEPTIARQLGSKDIASLAANAPDPATQRGIQPEPKLASTDSKEAAEGAQEPSRPSVRDGLDAVFGAAPRQRGASQPRPTPSVPNPPDPMSAMDQIRSMVEQSAQFSNRLSAKEKEDRARLNAMPMMGRSGSTLNQRLLADHLVNVGKYSSSYAARPTLRLKPSLGRYVDVTNSFEIARAFRQLEASCARNKVRADSRDQRFHVRRGQKRKEVRMQRWRKLFRDGFLEECARVRRMKKQGW